MFLASIIYLLVNLISPYRIKTFLVYILLPFYLIIMFYGKTLFKDLQMIHFSNRFLAMYLNPINFLTQGFINHFNQYNAKNLAVSYEQQGSIKLIDKAFLGASMPPQLDHPVFELKQWNVVLIVLESVGAKYIFDETQQHKIPMPFLKWLSTQGGWFKNHYTAGNYSALGQFSILTGIYPCPQLNHFEMQENLFIPTVASWVGPSYDSFFVSSSNDLFSSIGTLNTFSEYDNASVINPRANLFFNMLLNETEGFNFFMQRLHQTTQPFLAVYWACAAHFPYADYSNRYKIRNNINDPYARYLNSLAMIDHEIKQVYEFLNSTKLFDNTILIIVGDHGEMFGQHDYYMHGLSLYQDEIKVPLLIYAPKIIKPHVYQGITSHIDILATLLHIMNIPDKNKLQGESLLNDFTNRKYIFVYSDADEIAAISSDHVKMQISFSDARCVTYRLNEDPDELHPLSCTDQHQKQAILKFRNFQPNMLATYNQSFSNT